MTQLWQFVSLLGVHWIADFVMQTHWQAQNKSKNNTALSLHVWSYGCFLLAGSFIIFGVTFAVFKFVVLNGTLHWFTDYVTSRASSKLYAKQDWHNFFVVIGFDQLVHQTTLAATMVLL